MALLWADCHCSSRNRYRKQHSELPRESGKGCPSLCKLYFRRVKPVSVNLEWFEALSALTPNELVAIHDAARPFVPHHVLDNLHAAFANGADAAIPSLTVTDTVKHVDNTNTVLDTIDRSTLRRVQTPQAFHLINFFAFIRPMRIRGEAACFDDASLAEAAGLNVVCVDGASQLKKLLLLRI